MYFNCFKLFILKLYLIDFICCLQLKTPIFGRRMNTVNSTVRSALMDSDIVPDVIDSIAFNTSLVEVRYPSGVEVSLGNELTPLSVKDQPSVKWPADENQYYTLVMTDPDVPNRKEPINGEVKHWLVINIPGTDVSNGEPLAVYRGSQPPSGSGLHRYTFLVYKQRGPITHTEQVLRTPSREGRTNFKVRQFAKKYKLGEPIGANYYVAQYDEYVGSLKAQTRVRTRVRTRTRGRTGTKTRRSHLTAVDWAQKTPIRPKFPQMVCMKYEKYLQIQDMLKSYVNSNRL